MCKVKSMVCLVALVLASCALTAQALALGQIAVTKTASGPPLEPRNGTDSWADAARVDLRWEVQRGRRMGESTTAHIATDGAYLYVRFDVSQREPIAQSQRTNDVGQGVDDEVWIDLWPQGNDGFQYQFFATPNGTHYESSTENSTYAPQWESFGAVRDGGYTVIMKIPLAIMRGARSSRQWKVQLVRFIHATGEQAVWSYDTSQTNPDDLARAGSMEIDGLAAARAQPRIAPYVLGSLAAPSIGGTTSRVGADLSIPVTATTSFFATFHPDYSNVELDQQTIAPTAFPRSLTEVRPFFTQGSNNYNSTYCNICTIAALYTPAIPTPREGYAIDGKQGPYAFTAFDAVGPGRSDEAAALSYTSADLRWNASLQQVAVNTQFLKDVETVGGVFYNDLKHTVVYANYGNDAGTNVLQGNQAQYYDAGATWSSQTFSMWGGVHKYGVYFNPVDAFIAHTGVAGWGEYANKIWTFAPRDALAAVSLGEYVVREHGAVGLNQTNNKLDLDILTRSAIDVNITTGFDNLALSGGMLVPVSQRGITVMYHSGVQTNNPVSFDAHGASSNPTLLSFNTGLYGAGRLDTWIRSSSIRVGDHGSFAIDLDDTAQHFSNSSPNIQWFERIGYTYQIGPESSLGLGVRRVVGFPPVPNGGGNCEGTCSNISVAYHQRLPHVELYVAYGAPSGLSTAPQLLLKTIFYFGADKGT